MDRIIRVEGENAVSARNIGRAHARKAPGLGSDRGKIYGHVKNRRRNSVFIKDLPECFTVSQKCGLSARKRHYPIAPGQRAPGRFRSGNRKGGKQGLLVALNKIKNAMTARIHTGYEIRPRNRALWRYARLQAAKTPNLLQSS